MGRSWLMNGQNGLIFSSFTWKTVWRVEKFSVYYMKNRGQSGQTFKNQQTVMPVYLALKCNTYLVRCKSVSKILRSYVLLRFSRAVLTFVSCSEPLYRYLLTSLLCLHYWPKTTILSLSKFLTEVIFCVSW